MKLGFYIKLAFEGMRKNKQMYMPYFLTCIGMVMMYYIVNFLQYGNLLSYLPGATVAVEMIGLGGWVIAIFACIFLFYTNSFLIRRRKKEFGLYNILGMGKKNIGKILFWEALIIAVSSMGIGLVVGILLSKIAELGLVHIMRGDVNYTLSVSVQAIIATIKVFGVIFGLLFLNTLRQVKFSSAIALIRGESVGEKPPKGNWIVGILGVILLGGAYYIAVTIKEPVSALVLFFLAVIMVIIGTYLIMIAGSVLFCRILQKKKNYYYKSNHFVSVSSMVYRMKRNGAGLASICILATMVLVMISSTASMYFGGEDSLHSRYPKEINMNFTMDAVENLSDENIALLRSDIHAVLEQYQVVPEDIGDLRCIYVAGLLEGDTIETDVTKVNDFNISTFSDVIQVYFVPLSDYNAMMGANETLADGEALIYVYRNEYTGDTLSFNNGNSFKIKNQLDSFMSSVADLMSVLPSMALVVPDLAKSIEGLDTLADYNGDRMITLRWYYGFDTNIESEQQIALNRELRDEFSGSVVYENYGLLHCSSESREYMRNDYYGIFGGFFFLGIMLSVVFIFAAVLIIYYKQISEGYEDQMRFEIMQKVGMTKREIRRSINSQLLTVFFLPLIFSACHLAFAYPMIRKLLYLFNLNNVTLFAVTTCISVVVFALFYTLVYKITSNAYYRIVSGGKI